MKLREAKALFGVFALVIGFSGVAVAAEPSLRDKVETQVRHQIQISYPELTSYSLKLEILNESKLKTDRYRYELLNRPDQLVTGRFTLPIRYRDKMGTSFGFDAIQCNSQITAEGWVAISSVKKGDLLDSSNSATRNITINGDSINSVKLKLSLHEYTASRAIAKGQLILPWMIRLTPVVRAGDKLKIRVVADNVEISVQGTALDDGGVGDTIRIRNLNYQKIMNASVEDSQNAVVRVNH